MNRGIYDEELVNRARIFVERKRGAQSRLAREAGVTLDTMRRFKRGDRVDQSTVDKVRAALRRLELRYTDTEEGYVMEGVWERLAAELEDAAARLRIDDPFWPDARKRSICDDLMLVIENAQRVADDLIARAGADNEGPNP